VSVAADRALYALAYWLRRGDTGMMDRLRAALSDGERAEARETLYTPGVAESLQEMPEDELRARMIALAGKSRKAPMSKPQHEITTILPGGRGAPAVVLREPGWQQQAEAEREAQRRAETDAEVKRIEREAFLRKVTPPARLSVVEQVYADMARKKWFDEVAESRDLPRKQAELEAWAARVELERVMEPPARQPGAVEVRQARDNQYSNGLREWKSRVTPCGHRSCMPGNCVYG
jgi:hypothetical protein